MSADSLGETKVENNFHIGQHSCEKSVQISAKLFFPASRKDLESKLCYFNLEEYMRKKPGGCPEL